MAATNGQTLTSEAAEPLQEPSMEDILASIRRIIASDQNIAGARGSVASARPPAASAAPPVAPAALAMPVDAPVLPSYPGEIPNLDDLEALVQPPAPIGPEPAGPQAFDAASARREPAAQLHPELFPPADAAVSAEIYELDIVDRVAPPGVADDLISVAARSQVSSSFQLLADSLLRDPETIERIAQDVLRPMLKTWLDDNLPSMVERLVRAEIERVARGGRNRG